MMNSKTKAQNTLALLKDTLQNTEKKRVLVILLFKYVIGTYYDKPNSRLKKVTIKKIKEAMQQEQYIPSMDKRKEYLLLLDSVDWRPWLHHDKFPKKFRCPLSTLAILAKTHR